MINTIDELKEFLVWAKKEKLQVVKLGDQEFHFSTMALIDEATQATTASTPDLSVPPSSARLPAMTDEQLSEKEFEDLLFHSTR